MSDPIYLDFNATTPVLPEVVDAMLPYLHTHFGNPSSSHVYGRRAKEAVERARAQVAVLLDADASEVIFTGSATESNNLAIRGTLAARPERPHLVTSVIEHPATSEVCAWAATHGTSVSTAPVDAQGQVTLESLRSALSARTALLTLIHAQNETGVLQPVKAAAELAHVHGAWVHTDASQSLGKLPVSARALDVDLLTLAGHKLYAPKGVGALFVRRGVALEPLLRGASHERGLRPGTENVANIVGLGVACVAAGRDLAMRTAHLTALRERLFAALRAEVPSLGLNGHATERLPNTLSVRFPGVGGTALLDACPNLAASTGSACHDGHERASAVILAMGVSEHEAAGTVRLSVGVTTTQPQVDQAAAALVAAWRRLAVR